MIQDHLLLETLPAWANANEHLMWRGRHLDAVFLLEIGQRQFLFDVRRGVVASARKGPFVMPTWQFALRAAETDWEQFWAALPAPGFNDVMAMLKLRRLRMDGDLYPLMSNLLYFKEMLAGLRGLGQ